MSNIDHARSTSDDLYLEARERESAFRDKLRKEVIADLPLTYSLQPWRQQIRTGWGAWIEPDDVLVILLSDADFSGEEGLAYVEALNRVKAGIEAFVEREVEKRL